MFPGFNDRRSAIYLITDHRLLIPGLERPACFIRSIQRHCGQALPTKSSPRLAPKEAIGDSALPVTHVTRCAWIDLLFTMSDNTRSPAEAGDERIDISRTRIFGAVWWSQTGSNRRPPACKAGALPTELWPRSSRRRQISID